MTGDIYNAANPEEFQRRLLQRTLDRAIDRAAEHTRITGRTRSSDYRAIDACERRLEAHDRIVARAHELDAAEGSP